MSDHIRDELIVYLTQASALERLDLRLLGRGVTEARDDTVREIYVTHRHETEAHLELIDRQLAAHAAGHACDEDDQALGALRIAFSEREPHTPTQLAISAYAVESLEIALYHLLTHIADRAGAAETAAVAHAILEEEEQAAELLAGSFDRALAASLAGLGPATRT